MTEVFIHPISSATASATTKTFIYRKKVEENQELIKTINKEIEQAAKEGKSYASICLYDADVATEVVNQLFEDKGFKINVIGRGKTLVGEYTTYLYNWEQVK